MAISAMESGLSTIRLLLVDLSDKSCSSEGKHIRLEIRQATPNTTISIVVQNCTVSRSNAFHEFLGGRHTSFFPDPVLFWQGIW